MRFAHIADTHLGYRQYGLFERETDFYDHYSRLIDKIIEEKPDFIIHSGDLFETSRPPTKALLTAQENFLKLKDAKIPVYAIAGNHDIVMRKNALPPQVLYKKFGLKLIGPKNQFYDHEGVFIGGSPYRSKYHSKSLLNNLEKLENAAQEYKKKIIVLHQAIDKYLPFEFELKVGDLPNSFNYYAMGHLHTRILEDFGEGKLAYPGCPEIWRMDELGNYRKRGKGFNLVDMDEDIPAVEEVNVKISRKLLQRRIDYSNFDEEIKELRDLILKIDKKPIVELVIKGKSYNRSLVHENLNKLFMDITLQIRSKYESATVPETGDIEIGSLNIHDLMIERLKEYDEKTAEYSVAIFERLSSGHNEDAAVITKKFFDEEFQ
ncbi:metallophosphoesterase family protein [Methanobacterium sp. ACI-7]|uniref:metallophosphoesterase family protein n=1 Tax=unclassified Methanobacterium TaxID=2627676 RepID=UPI0039C0899E